jgi:hypothetical protein
MPVRIFLSVFALFFLFHTTPYAHAICHSVVHEKGIAHTHGDVDEDHSQEDHTSGKAKTQNSSPDFVKGQTTSPFKILFKTWSAIPLPTIDLLRLSLHRPPDIFRPPVSKEFGISHPNKAPPLV